jgi:invasion protein IalB
MIYTILKNFFIISSFLLYLTTFSLSEINSKKWNTKCSEDQKTCLAVIISEVKNNDNVMQTIATAIVQIGSSKQKKMNLVNEDDQTYKLSEENKNIPVLTVKLPLNADLTKKPVVIIDNKNLGSLNFTHCNSKDGCVSNVVVDDEVIDLFKSGKTMTVVMGIYRSGQNMKIEFPLKNFTKSYAKLIKE